MAIQITTTPAQIGIQQTPGKLNIQQPESDIRMHTQLPHVDIHTDPIKVQIDQYPCFAEEGLKNNRDFAKQYAELGKRKALEGIARITRQGNELAAIHQDSCTIAHQAEENAFSSHNVECNIDIIPKNRPKIDFIGGTVAIQSIDGKVDLKVKVNPPKIHFTPGKIAIYLRQKNHMHIEYLGRKFNHHG